MPIRLKNHKTQAVILNCDSKIATLSLFDNSKSCLFKFNCLKNSSLNSLEKLKLIFVKIVIIVNSQVALYFF